MRAKKSLGQNFLKSSLVINTMVQSAELSQRDTVIEIGPGKGALTRGLVGQAGKVIAIEKDAELIPVLEEKFKEEIQKQKLEIREGDILDLILHEQLPRSSYKVVANIPYYITGAILRAFLSNKNQPTEMVLLMQREVAERIVVRDGKHSILSLSVQVYGDAQLIKKVSPSAFSPQPKVDSAILKISNISKTHLNSTKMEEVFFEVIKAGFAHKRKTLGKNLQSIAKKEFITELFDTCNLDHKIRAEDVSLETWLEIAQHFSKIKK